MKARNLSDYELVKQFMEGNQQSLEVLINRHRNRIYTYILITVKKQHIAEDIFQDTFIKVINSLRAGKYYEDGKFVSWVTRIAHNLTIDYFRKEKKMNTQSNISGEIDLFNSTKFAEETIEQLMVKEQISKEVRAIIEELPADQKEIIVLRHYMEMSFKDISEQTGVSINTALGRMRYALINLRKIIEEKNLNLSII